MKKVTIIYSATILEELKDKLEEINVKAYSIIPTVYGKGLSTQPRFDNHIWPGKNQIMFIICDKESSKKILAVVNDLREEYSNEGIVGFIENIEDITTHENTNKI